MNIKRLAKTNYPRISVKARATLAKKLLNASSLLIVVDEAGDAVALVSRNCILHGKLLSECSLNRISMPYTTMVADAIGMMRKHQIDALRVYRNQEFVGAVTLADLTDELLEVLKHYKRMVQHVGHDMRNSIDNLNGLNTLLESNLKKPENIELMRLAKHSCDHAHDILQELLFAEKIGGSPYALEPTELNAFTQECAEEMKGILYSKEIALDISTSNIHFTKSTDRNYLKRVIHNLMSNACKFSQPGTMVRLSTKVEDGHFRLAVRDQGIGIPVDYQAHVFDQFTTVSRNGTRGEPSTGLGMFFSKHCIEKLGGRLYLESSDETGSCFIVEFASDEH